MTSPQITFSFWTGRPLGPYELLALLSSIREGHKTLLFTFGQLKNVPADVEVHDAREVVVESRIFRNPREPWSFAGFSNLFRYEAMKKFGGTWFDLDAIILRPLPTKPEFLFGEEDNEQTINGAILRLPSDSAALQHLATVSANADPASVRWGMLGPRLLTEVFGRYGLSEYALSREAFYPIGPRETWRLFAPAYREEVEVSLNNSLAVHLWSEVFRRTFKNFASAAPPRGSYLAEKFAQVGLSHAFTEMPIIPAVIVGRFLQRTYNTIPARVARRIVSSLSRVTFSHLRGKTKGVS